MHRNSYFSHGSLQFVDQKFGQSMHTSIISDISSFSEEGVLGGWGEAFSSPHGGEPQVWATAHDPPEGVIDIMSNLLHNPELIGQPHRFSSFFVSIIFHLLLFNLFCVKFQSQGSKGQGPGVGKSGVRGLGLKFRNLKFQILAPAQI